MEKQELEKYSRMDITMIHKESLVDIRTIKVNRLTQINGRMDDFFDRIRNPYCFLYDGTPIRISFSEEKHTLQERLKRYFVSRRRV